MERKCCAITRHKSHLSFNHLLKKHKVLPKSSEFMPPVKCQEGYKIARKAGRAYLRLRISQSHYKLRKLASKQQEISKRLAETISVDKNQELSHVILNNTKYITYTRLNSKL